MFEFGKDLRRIFSQARDGEDRTWLELIGADLLETEARQQAIDAGRVSCRRPTEAWLQASALWLEHARRAGRRASLARAVSCAETARRRAEGPLALEADLAQALALMLDHDLRGAVEPLEQALALVETTPARTRPALSARLAAAHGMARSRRARLDGGQAGRKAAAALLDAALHALKPHGPLAAERAEVQLERAALTLESGIAARDAGLLDQAGRDLHALVVECAADDRPITRARALTLSAAGLSALAGMAEDETSRSRAGEMFDAAAEVFTPDHSPLDWVAILIARAHRQPPSDAELQLARRLTLGEGLILGALVRDRQQSQAVARAARRRDAARLLSLEAEMHGRLMSQDARAAPLDWVVDQIGVAEARLARRRIDPDVPVRGLALALIQAAEVARDFSGVDLALRASALNVAVLAPNPSH